MRQGGIVGGIGVLMAIAAGTAPTSTAAAQAATSVTVAGIVQWADDAGRLHPVRDAAVFVEEHDISSVTTLGRVRTDSAGRYRYVHPDNEDGLAQGGLDLSISVAADPVFSPTAGPGLPPNYVLDSNRVDNVADGATVTIDLAADSPATRNDHAAFSIRDAVLYGEEYAERLVGQISRPRMFFPAAASSGTHRAESGDIFVSRQHWIEWDVLHHEYAHHVQAATGGAKGSLDHFLARNMAELQGKDQGTRTAWGEGWATWFAVTLQRELSLSGLGITNVGNTDWEDRSAGIDVSLEAIDELGSLGEDNEVSTFRILWDIYDALDDQRDRLSRGALAVFGESTAPLRLDAYWQRVVGDTTRVRPEQMPYACTFADHNVAPDIVAPVSGTVVDPDDPPTFVWERNGAGPGRRLNEFVVQFYTPGFGRLLAESPLLAFPQGADEASWVVTPETWRSLLRVAGPRFTWVVKGHNTSAPRSPSTGDYLSCPADLLSPRREVSLLIDRSSSMALELAALAEQGPQTLAGLDGTNARVAVATFSGHPEAGGSPSDSALDVVVPLTEDVEAAAAALSSMEALATDHPAPSTLSALADLAEGSVLGGWGPDASRAIVVVTDEPYEAPEPLTGATGSDVLAAAGGPGAPAGREPVPISAVTPGSAPDLAELAEASGGTSVIAAAPDEVPSALAEALGAVVSSPFVTTTTSVATVTAGDVARTWGRVGAADPLAVEASPAAAGVTTIDERVAPTWPVPGREVLAEIDVVAPPGLTEVRVLMDRSLVEAGDGLAVALGGRGLPRCSSGGGAPCFTRSESTDGLEVDVRLAESGTLGLTLPAPSSIEGACPPPTSLRPVFPDVSTTSPHAHAISCLAGEGLIRGFADGAFGAGAPVTRGQVASLLDRLLAATGVELAAGPDRFVDDEGSVHEEAIDRLAAAGIVRGSNAPDGTSRFSPERDVTRAQLASLLVRAWRLSAEEAASAPDTFTDDDGSVHEANIDALAALGVARGLDATTFGPDRSTRRDQAATFLARLWSRLVSEGWSI